KSSNSLCSAPPRKSAWSTKRMRTRSTPTRSRRRALWVLDIFCAGACLISRQRNEAIGARHDSPALHQKLTGALRNPRKLVEKHIMHEQQSTWQQKSRPLCNIIADLVIGVSCVHKKNCDRSLPLGSNNSC